MRMNLLTSFSTADGNISTHGLTHSKVGGPSAQKRIDHSAFERNRKKNNQYQFGFRQVSDDFMSVKFFERGKKQDIDCNDKYSSKCRD
jgi:hypothetical protein